VAHEGETVRIILTAGPSTGTPPSRAPVRVGPAYPQPFNPRVVIPFSLEKGESIRLVVVDLHGRVVKVLADGFWPQGEGRTSWDGTDAGGLTVGSGVYHAVLRTQEGSVSTSLVLVR